MKPPPTSEFRVSGFTATGSDFVLDFLPEFFPPPSKTNLAAFGGKLQYGGSPDARGCTRNEYDLAVESAPWRARCCGGVPCLRSRGTSDEGSGQSRSGHPQQRAAAHL